MRATPQTLTIAPDTASQASAITNFVSLYNTVVTTVSSLTALSNAGSSSQSAGLLTGDSAPQSISNRLASIVTGGVKSNGITATLASLGISFNTSLDVGTTPGTLSVDQGKLTSALQSNPQLVSTLFNKTTGVGAQLNSAWRASLQTHPSINAHQTLDAIRDRSQTTLVPQSNLIGKPKSGFATPLGEH